MSLRELSGMSLSELSLDKVCEGLELDPLNLSKELFLPIFTMTWSSFISLAFIFKSFDFILKLAV